MATFEVLLWCLSANPYLPQGQTLYQQMQYPQAIAVLQQARKVSGSTADERRQTLYLLARSQAAVGDWAGVGEAYQALLADDPEAVPPTDASPRLRTVFQDVKVALYPLGFVALQSLPSRPGVVAIRLIDPWVVVQSLALSQSLGAQPFAASAQPRPTATDRIELGLQALEPGQTLRYFVEARGSSDAVVAHLGSDDQPLSLTLPEPAPVVAVKPQWVKPAVSWSLTALALAAAGTGAGFAITAAHDSHAAGATNVGLARAALDHRAHDRALAANVLLSGAAVLAVGATVAFVW